MIGRGLQRNFGTALPDIRLGRLASDEPELDNSDEPLMVGTRAFMKSRMNPCFVSSVSVFRTGPPQ